MWPQITIIVLFALDVILAGLLHGSPNRTNFWRSLITALLFIWLLWAGNFWAVLN